MAPLATVALTPDNVIKTSNKKIYYKRNQSKTNRNALLNEISKFDWNPVYMAVNCEQKTQIFYRILNEMINTYLPMKKYVAQSSSKPWITDQFQDLIKRRQYYWKKGHMIIYRNLRNKANRMMKRLKSEFYERCMATPECNKPTVWWSHIKTILGINKKDCLSSLVCDRYNNDITKFVEEVNICFKNVSNNLEPLRNMPDPSVFPEEEIPSVQEISLLLSKINIKKAMGPDEIPNWIYKSGHNHMAGPIASIVSASMREQKWPSAWLQGNIIPIAKIKNPNDIRTDLRPITLTCPLAKSVPESIMSNLLMKYVGKNIDKRQYGGIKGRSTTHAMLSFMHPVYEATDNGKAARILLIDFSKGFDIIDINILTDKLKRLGSPQYLTRWCASFLAERQQRVCYNGYKSKWLNIHAGVPQGTKTGPLAFLAMINDLDVDLKYIDDSSVVEILDTPNQSKMNERIENITKWTDTNKMQINEKKTVELQICFSKKQDPWPPLTMKTTVLQPTNKAKLLGFIINNKLTWNDHIEYILKKSSKRVYFILMLKRARIPVEKITDVYKATIRSILEYGAPVWHTNLNTSDSNHIEDIQRRVLKIIHPQRNYEQGMKLCHLERLDTRRTDLCRKFFQSTSNNDFIRSVCNSNLRSAIHNNLRNRPQLNFNCKTNRFLNSFFPYANFNY